MAITINFVRLPVKPSLMFCIPAIFKTKKSAPSGALMIIYKAYKLSLRALPALNPTDLEAAI